MEKELQRTNYCEPMATVLDLHFDTHLCQTSGSDLTLPGNLPEDNLLFEDLTSLSSFTSIGL